MFDFRRASITVIVPARTTDSRFRPDPLVLKQFWSQVLEKHSINLGSFRWFEGLTKDNFRIR